MLLSPRTVLALVGLYAVALVAGIDLASMLIDWLQTEAMSGIW